MKSHWLLALVLSACSLFASEPNATFSIKNWLTQNAPTPIELSPNGEQVLWFNSELNALEVQWVRAKQLKRFTLQPHETFVDARYATDGSVILSTQFQNRFKVYAIRLDSSAIRLLIDQSEPLSITGNPMSSRGFWILTQQLLRHFDFDKRQFSEQRAVPLHTYAVKFTANNQPCVALTDTGQVWWWRSQRWHLIEKSVPLVRVEPFKECQQLLAMGQLGNTRTLLTITENDSFQKLFQHPDYDIEDFWIDRHNQTLGGVFYQAALPRFYATSKETARLASIVNRLEQNANWKILDQRQVIAQHPIRAMESNHAAASGHSADDSDIWLIALESPKLPPRLVWIDTSQGKVITLTKIADDSQNIHWAPTEVVETRVGSFTVSGYLTLPMNRTATTPLMVRLHGGPFAIRDYWRFDPEAQWLASQGIALLSINYRGSAGFGQAFQKASYGRLRETLEDDLESMLALVKARYHLTQAPVCLYGASFGGFAVLSELIENTSDYTCGIIVSSVVSLPLIYQGLQQPDERTKFRYSFGNPDDEAWRKKNNLLMQLNAISVPLLVIYGDKDQKVLPDHSRQLIEGMKQLGKPVTEIVIKGADHELNRLDDRITLYQSMIDFLTQQHFIHNDDAEI
jgi:alpha-beta hydrolase superfamily lysophospholipase